MVTSQDCIFDDCCPISSLQVIKSTWRDALGTSTTGSSQTDPMKVQVQFVQTTLRAVKLTQTEGVHAQTLNRNSSSVGGSKAPPPPPVNMHGLQGFMEKVFDAANSEMTKVEEEHEVLEPLMRTQDEKQEPATCTFELAAFGDPAGAANMNVSMQASAVAQARSKLVVTSVSWSMSGQTIAAAYGRHDIPGWCEDRGALTTWNLGHGSVNQYKADITIDVDNCLMACAFHPEHQALIAGGTFNGDVYIWDLSHEGDMQVGKTDAISDLRHREPICSMIWHYSSTEYNKYGNKAQAYRLITLGADGLIMIWTYHKLKTALYGYKLMWQQPGGHNKVIFGGTSMSMLSQGGTGAHHHQMDGTATLMVGTEGGKIFRCYMELNEAALRDFSKAAASGTDKVDLRNPIKEGDYAMHAGSVLGLSCSPFQRDLFLTSGFDGCIHLYSALKKQFLLELVPSERQLYTVQWSPFRPFVFAAAGGDGRVFIYDLLRIPKGMLTPALVIEASPDGMPVHSMAFNCSNPEMFATGGATGVQIWKLPESLGGVRKGEVNLLRRMLAADDFEEALRNQSAQRG